MTKLIDAAKAAGIAITTVSRVQNNPATVNADTQLWSISYKDIIKPI